MERGSPQYACALATLTKRGDGKGTDEQNHLDLGGGKARKGGARATESVGILRERFSLEQFYGGRTSEKEPFFSFRDLRNTTESE